MGTPNKTYGQRVLEPDEYPMVNDHGVERVADEQDLMNLGLFRARDGDVDFASVEAFKDRRGQHKPGIELPGRLIASGKDRHRRIPKADRARMLQARVMRGGRERVVRMDEKQVGDVVVAELLPSLLFAGERS